MLSAAIWFSSLCTFMYLRLKEGNNGWTSNICAIDWRTNQFFVLFLLMTCHLLKSYSRKLWRCLPLREKLTMSCLLGYVWPYLCETLTIPQQDQGHIGQPLSSTGGKKKNIIFTPYIKAPQLRSRKLNARNCGSIEVRKWQQSFFMR